MVGIREEEFGRELGGTKWEKSTGSSITEGSGQPSWGRFELRSLSPNLPQKLNSTKLYGQKITRKLGVSWY